MLSIYIGRQLQHFLAWASRLIPFCDRAARSWLPTRLPRTFLLVPDSRLRSSTSLAPDSGLADSLPWLFTLALVDYSSGCLIVSLDFDPTVGFQ